MNKYIVALLVTDEALTLLIVEPLYGTLAHDAYLQIDIKIKFMLQDILQLT